MIQITSAQVDAWLALFMFPLARILGLVATAPVYQNAVLSMRIRLILGLAIVLALAPALPPMPAIPAGSWVGLVVLAQQTLIGIVMGFTLRLMFAAVDMAGELIGLQMGLSFATFYDPMTSGQTPVVTEFISLVATLIYLAMNGHLLTLSALAESFHLFPVSTQWFASKGLGTLLASAATLFSAGVLLSLPLITALLIANLALGVLSRVAPTLNLFAVGFPVTIMAGFLVLTLSLPYLGSALERFYTQAFSALGLVMRAGML
ncbi:flagellar biosynthetic protein FliR [Denitratisoma oestradiolicum]|uniref:Flagellar biosynthetic protein FliR n=1 Tax=Denitratisoma oestradiolicum TaxID=311182 RepID=A0A6S6Y559_9PROT|nr:flagellar biosynthetic protein FliR [Denitratisoma oestradiolicum]TWO81593.1 flagellar biosynthetic protein FliR [Denitratisoma oestradiolicum]CAB1370530.1 flagellar export pore protein [Denitratisoma oestradiolicum]